MHQVCKLFIFSALIFTLGFSCSQKAKESFEGIPRLINNKLISDRGIEYDQGVVLLRLKRPPLLKTATKDSNGKIVINENEKNALIAEQEDLLKRLKKISSEIELIYSYKLSFNGIAVAIPAEYYGDVFNIEGITSSYKREIFEEIKVDEAEMNSSETIENSFPYTTADFIGARQTGFKGKGIKIAIFDTGIDYTHAMFKGPGTVSAYESVDPKKENPLFPNQKVVGGIDLVGETFQAWSLRGNAIPKMDNNPMDTRGHGTHVAGTAAGIGDDIHTFDGIAPEAELYAIKVFGGGGTGDDIVIAGIEWCLDPNGDYDLSDRIHIGNMSLGGRNGRTYSYYNEAVSNALIADFIVVASAGNSGAVPYIVGSPSTTPGATSVGATIGGMDYLWKTDKVATISSNGLDNIVVELIQGTITKPVADVGQLTEELVYVGLANESLSEEVRNKLQGKIALIDRGGASFIIKLTNVKAAGAVGAVVVNNVAGADPISMGGEGSVDIPGIMITAEVGDLIKNQLTQGQSVKVEFNSDDIFEKPHLIDNITRFSSQGPSVDTGAFKPEIVAPGYQVISARRGSGNLASRLNGTSMSAPQIAGAYALMKEAYPTRSAQELKAMMVGSAKSIKNNKTNERYLLSRQGAGRIQLDKAIKAKVITKPETVSLGFIEIHEKITFKKTLELLNLSQDEISYDVKYVAYDSMSITGPTHLTLKAGETKTMAYEVTIKQDSTKNGSFELNGDIQFLKSGEAVLHTPILAVAKLKSSTTLTELSVTGDRSPASLGAQGIVTVKNTSGTKAIVEVFNLVDVDAKKEIVPGLGIYKARECDLQAFGHRLVKKEGKEFIQFGIKIYNPTSIWDVCEVSVLFDTDDDGTADFELGGIKANSVTGLSDFVSTPNQFVSALVDANKARSLRMAYELATRNGEAFSLNYKDAVLGTSSMVTYSQSTVALIEYDKSLVPVRGDGKLKVRVASLAGNANDVDSDDYLGVDDKWHLISAHAEEMAFYHLPQTLEVLPGESKLIELTKGKGSGEVAVFIPTNESVLPDETKHDQQLFILRPKFSH